MVENTALSRIVIPNINWDGGARGRSRSISRLYGSANHAPKTTQETYEFRPSVQKYQVSVSGPRVDIAGQHWLELTCDDRLALSADHLEGVINHLRGLV